MCFVLLKGPEKQTILLLLSFMTSLCKLILVPNTKLACGDSRRQWHIDWFGRLTKNPTSKRNERTWHSSGGQYTWSGGGVGGGQPWAISENESVAPALFQKKQHPSYPLQQTVTSGPYNKWQWCGHIHAHLKPSGFKGEPGHFHTLTECILGQVVPEERHSIHKLVGEYFTVKPSLDSGECQTWSPRDKLS